ncbi:MAG: hypothetical protein IJN80_06435 [Clostridia bacterium]|nr:hypothetical protein [Clostridia bacterium]
MKTNVFNSKRILSLFLALVMVFSMMPMTALPAFAVDTTPSADKAIMLGTSGISDPTAIKGQMGTQYTTYYTPSDYVYFGVNGSDPMKWRVLDADAANNGASGGMFLLSEYLLDRGNVMFNASTDDGNTYQGSKAQEWCNTFAQSSAFSMAEQAAFLGVEKTDNAEMILYKWSWGTSSLTENDKVFFLSVRELADYVGDYNDAPGLSATDTAQSASYWWLRSLFEPLYSTDQAGAVSDSGMVNGEYVDGSIFISEYAARPAFNLNLNSVIFTSAAVGGKADTSVDGSLTEVGTAGTEWKMTLLDDSRSFTASTSSATTQTVGYSDWTVDVTYSGANTGNNEYVSAMLVDSNDTVLYYGRIANNSESGTATITIPSDLAVGSYTLKVFSEQHNGDKMTDYASGFANIPLTVLAPPVLWVGGTAVTSQNTSGEGWSYDYATNTLTLNGASITSGSYADASIYAKEALNIVLNGSNTVSSGANYGIYANSTVNISGDGSLSVVGHWDGIQAHGNVTVNSGSITSTGESSYGIKAEGNTLTFNGGYVSANGGASGNGIVANTVVLGSSSHLKVTHSSAAVSGTLSATGGLCRTSEDGAFSDVVTASGAYFEYMGSNHVAYTKKDAQNHTVACTHGISFDATHEYENGACVCTAEDPMYGCDFIVTGDPANYSWDKTNKVLTINGGNVTVSNKDKNTATSHRIYIQGTANVTLDGVNISTTTGAPIEIRDYNDTNVTLTLSGNNTLISQTANKAAIHKTRGQQATSSDAATLTINGSGSLTAVGGSNAAGIGGGGHRGDTHNIIINSGTISATGKGWAAGIGSSNDGSTWNIVINGGNISASGSPGIGANTDNWQGVKDSSIAGGMVTTNSYKGSTPTGGLVSTDGGKTFTVFSDYTLSRDLTIATDGKLTVAEGTKLIIADGFTLTNKGVIVNDGTISGNLVNEGTIYNKGTLPANVGGTVYEQYVKVNNGSGTGNYTEGSTVTITADAPASGMMFTGWTIELGTITLTDSTKAETTFTMPKGCVIVKANYSDIVATITDSNGNVQYYSDGFRAQEDWTRNGGTLTVYSDDFRLEHMDAPDGSVLDLNGHSVEPMMLHIRNSCTIQNGTISMWHEGIVEEDAVVTFKNVTITNDEHGSWEVEIINDGTIIDEGLTLNGVIISGGPVKTGLTEDRVTLSGIPTEGYVYDGTAQEPGVKCGETTLVAGTDYTVTFSNSNGGNSTVNAGTITMTITGKGNYAGTVTKTYTITDTTAPTGTILIKENSWREFWNWISFGLFCKDHVDVTITADGTGSNVTKVEYLLSNTVMEENNIPNDGWTALTKDGNAYKFRIQPKSKVAVYVRITDEGGNVTIINSDGIVVYEDSKAIDTEATYTYKENSNKGIAVEFNGNTVKSITCGEKVLAANTDYSVDYESGKIVLKSTYLDTLNAGEYTFTVSYNPMGFENSGVTDLTTTFTVKVEPTSIAGATVTVDSTFTYDGNAKTPDPVVVLNGETLVKDRDYTVSYTENVNAGTATVTVTGKGNYSGTASGEYEITKREITIIVDAKNTVVNTTLPTYTYKVEGLVGVDALVTVPTLTCNANIAVVGEYDITASDADAGGNYSIKYVPAKLTVLTDNVVDVAAGYTEELKDYDPATVTSEDKDELQDMLDEINTILGDETITTNGKNAMEEVKKQVEDLIKEITDAAEATDTENTKKVEDVTAENVTPDNKTDLEKSKADLEKALDEHGNNMTEDEKKAIEDEIKRIDDALEVIGNVEEIEETISKLPAVDTVKPDDEEAIKAITDAQTAYNALSEYEKSLVDEATKASLDKLVAALVAYDIVEGDGSSWTEDSDHNITFVVNGLFSKFVGIKVDGKVVDKANYETKAGSTIITLKASYLDTLKAGEHTITVLYTDGETEGTFNVHAKTNSPATGDNSNIFLWIALLFISGTGIFGITLYDRKRKTANK